MRFGPLLLVVTTLHGSAPAAAAGGKPVRLAADQPPPLTDAQGNGTLSDKLSRSGGVIRPQGDVDPAILQPAPPAGGAMPVIPAPGTPGGDPSVQPK